jgi:hypothetical protein
MAKLLLPSPQSVPSTEAENQNVPADPLEPTPVDIEARASTTTTVLHEILAQRDDNYYVYHWGINE